jgi:glutamate synthase domain-containing protein 1
MATGLYDAAYEHDACGVGMVADLHGRPDHGIVDKGLSVLERLAHRGASGSEVSTGDGAGILVQIPHRFLVGAAESAGFMLPEQGAYAVGLAFLPRDVDDAAKAKKVLEALAAEEGLGVLGWRVVPVEPTGRRPGFGPGVGVATATSWRWRARLSCCANGPSTRWTGSTSRRCRPGRSSTRAC